MKHQTILIILLILIGLMVILALLRRQQGRTETFVDSKNYKARLAVIDVFDENMKRIATPKEINRYSQYKTKEKIREMVKKDYPSEFEKNDKKEEKPFSLSDNLSKNIQGMKTRMNPFKKDKTEGKEGNKKTENLTMKKTSSKKSKEANKENFMNSRKQKAIQKRKRRVNRETFVDDPEDEFYMRHGYGKPRDRKDRYEEDIPELQAKQKQREEEEEMDEGRNYEGSRSMQTYSTEPSFDPEEEDDINDMDEMDGDMEEDMGDDFDDIEDDEEDIDDMAPPEDIPSGTMDDEPSDNIDDMDDMDDMDDVTQEETELTVRDAETMDGGVDTLLDNDVDDDLGDAEDNEPSLPERSRPPTSSSTDPVEDMIASGNVETFKQTKDKVKKGYIMVPRTDIKKMSTHLNKTVNVLGGILKKA